MRNDADRLEDFSVSLSYRIHGERVESVDFGPTLPTGKIAR